MRSHRRDVDKPSGRGVRWAVVAFVCLTVIGCGSREELAPPEPTHGETRRSAAHERFSEGPGGSCDLAALNVTPDQLREGFEIWQVVCEGCHGGQAKGQGRVSELLTAEPGDLTDPERAEFFSDSDRIQFIADGMEGTPMIGWKDVLSDEEIVSVYGYFCSLAQREREGDRE
jgi:mono/diheme cytochrome c family protein